MTHKTFKQDDAVEIQRDVDAPWELAVYDKPRLGQERSGWHIVKLPEDAPPRYVDMMGTPVKMNWVAVPSVRIRRPRAQEGR